MSDQAPPVDLSNISVVIEPIHKPHTFIGFNITPPVPYVSIGGVTLYPRFDSKNVYWVYHVDNKKAEYHRVLTVRVVDSSDSISIAVEHPTLDVNGVLQWVKKPTLTSE